jgi:hypothetical protein
MILPEIVWIRNTFLLFNLLYLTLAGVVSNLPRDWRLRADGVAAKLVDGVDTVDEQLIGVILSELVASSLAGALALPPGEEISVEKDTRHFYTACSYLLLVTFWLMTSDRASRDCPAISKAYVAIHQSIGLALTIVRQPRNCIFIKGLAHNLGLKISALYEQFPRRRAGTWVRIEYFMQRTR